MTPKDKARFEKFMAGAVRPVAVFPPNVLPECIVPLPGLRIMVSDWCPPGKFWLIDGAALAHKLAMQPESVEFR